MKPRDSRGGYNAGGVSVMRFTLLLCVIGALGFAADKKPVTNEAGNENVDISANPLVTPEEIRAALGAELPPGIIAVVVKIVPRGDAPLVSVSRDDFILLSHKDGQRSGPYSPSQIAGASVMTVTSQTRGGGGLARQSNGPIWGGIPGAGGRPRQVDGGESPVVGNTGSAETITTATIKDEKTKTENPLLKLLEEKMLPDKETSDPLTGLLYFPLEGKVKMKDLKLLYRGPAGRLSIEFR